ncbi:enoyl-CoA hydratase/isomerase family protein [Kordiimonas aquimaris]|uniref:enoyl-CoA hydratase/isomerase family protein n=1 Tax=Kordiimonas aquimaris TaxID=707591 RepID=UPI0021CE788A|nr:enoyl-CoA hydratase/isomerase family protein [Kordiimonas aquimaris]
MDNNLLIETDTRGVATVTLNRPDVHNAFNDSVIADLHTAYNTLGMDESVRVIVLTGAGKSFSAGADLNWMKRSATFTAAENKEDAMRLSGMLAAIRNCPKPTLAFVNGAAFGGGVGLTACCDIAVAMATGVFSLSEVKLGLTPATISPYVIAAIGERAAQRYFLTGERFDGIEARRIGLVHEIAQTRDEAEMIIEGIIDQLLSSGPVAQAECKSLIQFVAGAEITDELRAETAERIAARRTSAEGQEGLSAFFEKRKPSWSSEQ